MEISSLASARCVIMTAIFIIAVLALPSTTKGSVTLLRNGASGELLSIPSFSMRFLNNSFDALEGEVIVLKSSLTSPLPKEVKGRIAIYNYIPTGEDGYITQQLIVLLAFEALEKGCKAIIFPKTQCCFGVYIPDSEKVPTAVLTQNDTISLFNLTGIAFASDALHAKLGEADAQFELMNASFALRVTPGIKEVNYFSTVEYTVIFEGFLSVCCISLMLFIVHSVHQWIVHVEWHLKNLPSLAVTTFVFEFIATLSRLLYVMLYNRPTDARVLQFFDYFPLALANFTKITMSLFWVDLLNAVSINEIGFIRRFKFQLFALCILLLCGMLFSVAFPSLQLYVMIVIEVFSIVQMVVFSWISVRFLREVGNTSGNANSNGNGRLRKITWNVIGTIVNAFFALILFGVFMLVSDEWAQSRVLAAVYFFTIGVSFFTVRAFDPPKKAQAAATAQKSGGTGRSGK